MMQERLSTVEGQLKSILEQMAILSAREARRGAILDKLIDDEVQRQDMYRHIKKHVLGTGVFAGISMIGAILWYAFKAFLARQ